MQVGRRASNLLQSWFRYRKVNAVFWIVHMWKALSVVVAEGVLRRPDKAADLLQERIKKQTGIETRETVLGYIQVE
jgi:hypothetical protein